MVPGRLCVLVCLKALLAFATDTAAAETIAGTVRDASGAAIAKADIILATPELTVVAASVSDAQGSFSITGACAGQLPAHRAGARFRRGAPRRHRAAGHDSGRSKSCCEVGPLQEEVTGRRLSRQRRLASRLRATGQRHHRRRNRGASEDRGCPGGRGRDRRAPPADQPDDGGHLRAWPDREQSERLRRRRALFERRPARRRQHVPRSDRAGRARDD